MWALGASVAAAVVPIVVALVRALRDDWIPIGDDAMFALRARDVLTSHHPLLGTWTSGSQSLGIQVNNPGPLLFDMLALPLGVFGRPGVAVAVAALNIAAVVGIAVVASRRGGPLVATAAMAVTSALAWSMGSTILIQPWQPHALVLPFLLFVFMVAALADGDVVILPWTVAVASLVLQTHLSYAFLVPVLSLWGMAGLVVRLRQRRRAEPDRWRADARRVKRALVAAVVVLAVCWFQPLIEQFQHGSDGNLARIATHSPGEGAKVGASDGVRIAASVLSLPPFSLRPSFADSFIPEQGATPAGVAPERADLPTLSMAALSIVLLGVVLVLCWRSARRRHDQFAATVVGTAAVAVGAVVLTAITLPISSYGIAPHQFRWLWPASAFVMFAVLVVVGRALSRTDQTERRFVAGFAIAAVVFGLCNLPAYNAGVGPSSETAAIPVVRDLLSQMGALRDRGTLLLDTSNLRFGEPYDAPVMDEMTRRGIPFVVSDEVTARQVGSDRARPEQASAILRLREADAADQVPPGETRVAYATSLTDEEQQELDALRAQVAGYLETNGVPLNEAGERALRDGKLTLLAAQRAANTVDVAALLRAREVVQLRDDDLIALDDGWAPIFDRYVELQRERDAHTVALYVAPLGSRA